MDMDGTFLTKIPIAHRGLHGKNTPENSPSAFLAAIKKGYAIETDVRLTKEGELVIFHDDDLVRLFQIEKDVCDCTLAQLRKLRLPSGEKIITLAEFLALVKGKTPVLLEIKSVRGAKTGEYAQKIKKEFEGYEGEYAVQSFHPLLARAYKKLCPEIACGVLSTSLSKKSDYKNSPFWRIKAHIVKNNSLNFLIKPDFISYRAEDLPERKRNKFQGIRLAWVVRSYATEQMIRHDADNIIFEDYLPEMKY